MTVERLVFAGILAGAALGTSAYVAAAARVQREDRPPIIVKGSSLVFQSGAAAQGKRGKPWRERRSEHAAQKSRPEWNPDHPLGKPVRSLTVAFGRGTGACSTQSLAEVTVHYDPDGSGPGQEVSFMITRQPLQGGGPMVPAVIGTGLTADNSGDYPTLSLKGPNTSFRMAYTDAGGTARECRPAGDVTIDFVE